MKQFIALILFSWISVSVQAQASWCATDEMLEEWFESNPGEREKFFNPALQEIQSRGVKGGQNSKAPNYIIPVVVHVIHYNGAGNISEEQIQDGLDIINVDFNKLNSDTSSVRSIFKPLIADAQVEFRLAKKDPNGLCTNGINRINSFLTYDNRDQVKALSYWDANKYFNVWIVNTIFDNGASGDVLGYAQFPYSGADATYGVVVRANEWGSIELASGKSGRTVTHEMGHCFNLLHTFQGGCGNVCSTSGDFICDTPPQASSNNNSCNMLLNTCSNDAVGGIPSSNPNPYSTNVPDQLENFMGYGLACHVMFTEGQKSRMVQALNNVTRLVNLTKATNLVATGTNNAYTPVQCPPVADLYFDVKMLCKGSSVTFSDNSYRDTVTIYEWTFPGGTPSTSSAASPNITYNTPGTYDVKLKVSNPAGSDSITVTDHVIVFDTANNVSGFGYFEGFENSLRFNEWTVISPTGNPQWLRSTITSYSGVYSAYLNNFNVELNDNINTVQYDHLISPPIDMSQVINPSIKFEVAYKSQNVSSNDNLKIGISTDCGASWSTRFFANSNSNLINSGSSTTNFVPSGLSEWKTVTVTLTSAMKASENLLIRFDFTSGSGNNMYIDNVEVTGQSIVGLEDSREMMSEFKIYPNPAGKNGFYMRIEDNKSMDQAKILITNIVGEQVKEILNPKSNKTDNTIFIETNELSSGIYFVSYQNSGRRITKKLVIN